LVQTYTELRKQAGKKDGTILTELNHLRNTLSWAKKTGLIDSYPYFQLPSAPPPSTSFLTKEQAREFLNACTAPHVYLFTLLALTTGARTSAILELQWSQVDLQKRQIDFSVTKKDHQKTRPVVPVNDTLFTALSKVENKEGYVIQWCSERVRSVKKAIRLAGRKCSLRVYPHMFRHSAAVWMLEDGVPMEEVSQFLGHSSVNITRKVYARYSPEYLRKAGKALDL
jgi:integrase